MLVRGSGGLKCMVCKEIGHGEKGRWWQDQSLGKRI